MEFQKLIRDIAGMGTKACHKIHLKQLPLELQMLLVGTEPSIPDVQPRTPRYHVCCVMPS